MEWFRKYSLAAYPAKFQTMLVKSNNIKDAELMSLLIMILCRPQTQWKY